MPHPNFSDTFVASADIRPCRIVKVNASADFGCTEADANEAGLGISHEGTRAFDSTLAAAAGDHLQVYVNGCPDCLLEIGSGGVSAGDMIKSDADGKGVAAATTGATAQNVVAIAKEAGAEGAKIRVRVVLLPKLYPALA